MAIKKDIDFKFHTFGYWIIMGKNYNKKSDLTTCIVVGYRNKNARNDSFDNFFNELTREYQFPGELTRSECYPLITNHSDGYFAGAIDDLD